MRLLSISAFVLFSAVLVMPVGSGEPEARIEIEGHAQETRSLNALLDLHLPHAFSDCTLWDGWLPHSTLWTGPGARDRYRASLTRRRIDDEGYVSMQQHRGMAHSEGWPFPAWQQSTGSGWHFSTAGEGWALQNFNLQPLQSTDGWELEGVEVDGIDPRRGLMLRVTEDNAEIVGPEFRCGTIVAPFARVEWAVSGSSPQSGASLDWLLEGEHEWVDSRRVAMRLSTDGAGHQFANVPLYRQPGYGGLVTRYRISLASMKGAKVDLKSLITAIDSRHPITGSLYARAVAETFAWTNDLEFLKSNIERVRRAIRYCLDEFRVEQERHVVVHWVGHDGRSGLVANPTGRPTMRPGLGVGNNYWDLLPFGGHDALATIYLYDALVWMSELEAAIAAHTEWGIPVAEASGGASHLADIAAGMKIDFQKRFWNEETGRFVGWVDLAGQSYDYGFTFVNLEAIHYGLASDAQAAEILNWVDGARIVEGDTSTGADIYHWRFAPRATTRRNVETYMWAWADPGAIPWGGQVQDGGAVLGFSYHDLMARLKTRGPDDAWQRLQEILQWFDEVQAEGGYRAYYAKAGRGSLQGGGTAGGLGLDQEFMESVLVPQIVLYGFVGFRPTADGYEVKPNLPSSWKSVTVRDVHLKDRVVDITVDANGEWELVDK